jgi:hypothetical protein
MLGRTKKHAGIAVAALIGGFVAGCVGAVVSSPFWGWFEARTGIESLGHSGPADWVFTTLIGLAVVVIFGVLEFIFREKPPAASGEEA